MKGLHHSWWPSPGGSTDPALTRLRSIAVDAELLDAFIVYEFAARIDPNAVLRQPAEARARVGRYVADYVLIDMRRPSSVKPTPWQCADEVATANRTSCPAPASRRLPSSGHAEVPPRLLRGWQAVLGEPAELMSGASSTPAVTDNAPAALYVCTNSLSLKRSGRKSGHCRVARALA